MALSPQKFREMVLQMMYGLEFTETSNPDLIDLIMETLTVSKKNVRLAAERVAHIYEKIKEIDDAISVVSTSYDFERIQVVTKCILRIGVFEILFDDQIPPRVAISEAIRLSRKFSTPESADFVNAVLDSIYNKKTAPHVLDEQV